MCCNSFRLARSWLMAKRLLTVPLLAGLATFALWTCHAPAGESNKPLPVKEATDRFASGGTAINVWRFERGKGGSLYSKSGNSSRGSSKRIDRAWPGSRSMKPRFSRVRTI